MLENLLQAAEHLAGFAIVLIALLALWGITALVGRYFIARTPSTASALPVPARAEPTTVAPAEPATVPASDIPEDIIAVIASAVTFMLDQRHQIVSVRAAPSRWGIQGKSDIHASHRLR